eukprot:TRINITY_DN3932_c0_g1_i1.p3 TRINITY_DN3932_c0_g1~~TRINITY_DN3932_c0_g1_i1.p3  ORF type:complete len:155 (+),score=14.66 TRINITY_DN3932_c0_g1_i1:954-1418(+)
MVEKPNKHIAKLMLEEYDLLHRVYEIDLSTLFSLHFQGHYLCEAFSKCKPYEVQAMLEPFLELQPNLATLTGKPSFWSIFLRNKCLEGLKIIIKYQSGMYYNAFGESIIVYHAKYLDNPFCDPTCNYYVTNFRVVFQKQYTAERVQFAMLFVLQ